VNTKIKTWVGTVIIIIMAITAVTSVWLYEKNQLEIASPVQVKIPVKQKNTTQKSENPTVADNQNYIEVKELGFKFPVDTEMAKEVTYKIIKPLGVPYSSAEIDSQTGGCEGGVISKIPGTPSKNVTGESEFYTARMSDIKQFNGFFLFYQHPQAVSCDVVKYGDVQQKIIQATSDMFKNISLIDQNATTSDLSSKALATEDWQTYRSEKYGFELSLPGGSGNYKVSIEKDIKPGMTYIFFLLPLQNSKDYFFENSVTKEKYPSHASPIGITVWNPNIWDKMIAEKCEGLDCPRDMLARNSKYVFGNIDFSNGFGLDEFGIKQSYDEISERIKKTFRLIQ